MKLFKNRTMLGIFCIAVSLIICFAITPLVNAGLSKKVTIVRFNKQVNEGEEITRSMLDEVEVGNHNLPENVIRNIADVEGKYLTTTVYAGDYILTDKISDEPAAENKYLYSLNGEKQAIGGFPLAATMNDIRPMWASEIEPFPMAVTAYRFPQMKHMGDITKLHGANLPVVDVIAGGSPCQDLSVAGKREGLAGERSGLFMEQVRIVKEMRKQDGRRMRNHRRRTDEFIRPRYMLWENVPGAFSSGETHGADFHTVLEEVCRIKEADGSLPEPMRF